MIRDLAPLVGRRLCFGVVPDWHGTWPLARHPDYCTLVQESSEELLLHGYHHRRERGWGPVSLLAEGSDEMNGLDPAETRRTIERGQRDFTHAFGEPARGFLAPAWQRGHVRREQAHATGIEYVLGFFSIESCAGPRVPLATWTWDCGRWSWLGHIGHGVGWTLQSLDRGTRVLALHPRDVDRQYWRRILALTETLLAEGFEPTSPARLLEQCEAEDKDAEVAV